MRRERLHGQRDRAESFGAVALDYDRYRPGYPAEVLDEVVALVAERRQRVLDVGCGTGKLARLLAERGLDVLGLEPDGEMAAVARTHGLRVEVSAFESWDGGEATFGLLTCAQAWHWIDPVLGPAQAARVLAPGATLALLWNYFDDIDPAVRRVANGVYARLAPQLELSAAQPDAEDPIYAPDLRASGRFEDVTTRHHPWQLRESVDDWVGRVGTHSDHLLLGAQRLAELQDALRVALHELGPDVRSTGGTYTVLARRA